MRRIVYALLALLFALLLAGGIGWRNRSEPPSPSPAVLAPPVSPVPSVPLAPPAMQEAPYVAPVTEDPKLAAFVNRSLPLAKRIGPDAPLPRLAVAGDFPALVCVLRDGADHDTVRNEAANLLRRSEYPGLPQVLIEVLKEPVEGPRFRAFATQHLGLALETLAGPARTAVIECLREKLVDRDLEVRREALFALVRAGDPAGKTATLAWLEASGAEAEATRDLAIRCARELNLREKLPLIRAHAREGSESVRIAALVALSEWGDTESRALMEDAARSENTRIQRAGQAALARLPSALPEGQ